MWIGGPKRGCEVRGQGDLQGEDRGGGEGCRGGGFLPGGMPKPPPQPMAVIVSLWPY